VHSSVESALKGGGEAKRGICVNTTSVAVLHEQTGTDVSGVNPPDFDFGEALRQLPALSRSGTAE
jgi:hypothetical protein